MCLFLKSFYAFYIFHSRRLYSININKNLGIKYEYFSSANNNPLIIKNKLLIKIIMQCNTEKNMYKSLYYILIADLYISQVSFILCFKLLLTKC